MAASPAMDNYDDDLDLEGPIFAGSTHQPSIVSSRLSIRSESNAGDDDWNVSITPNDETSTSEAISSAKLIGIPIPANVPASALLGGTIKKLGKKVSRQTLNEDWGEDMDFDEPTIGSAGLGGGLKLKTLQQDPAADEDDGFSDDWADGSLGIRAAGARRDTAGSAMSRIISSSLSSTALDALDNEDDGFDGLVIPTGPLSLEAAMKKRNDFETSFTPIDAPTIRQTTTTALPALTEDRSLVEDFLADLDFGHDSKLDLRTRTLNRNVKPSWKPARELQSKPQTTITFSDRGSGTRIPRPVIGKPQRLETVNEHPPTNITKMPRAEPAMTGPQLLRSKRSMPALRSQPSTTFRPPMPTNNLHSQLQSARIGQYGNRRESGPRAQSPTHRVQSRLSHNFVPDTPTRPARRDVAPLSLVREAAVKRTVTKPPRRKNFGDGTELDTFDDLPTSVAKESKFLKQPSLRGPPKGLKKQPSQSKLGLREKMITPLPPVTPRSPAKSSSHGLPSFARDTAASRIAREHTLGTIKPVSKEPFRGRTDWTAQVAARTPHASPTANRVGRRGPTLITPMGKDNIRHFQDEAMKKGMQWNPVASRWEGNDGALQLFDPTPPPSPPRPALITNVSGTKGVQIVGGMVFDPQRMCWLKVGGGGNGPPSASLDDDDDPFRDIEDLQESKPVDNGSSAGGRNLASSEWLVGEEFDLGPEFIRRQREEEVAWRGKIGSWFSGGALPNQSEEYKWAIRNIAGMV